MNRENDQIRCQVQSNDPVFANGIKLNLLIETGFGSTGETKTENISRIRSIWGFEFSKLSLAI